MKKITIIAFALSLIFIGCKKEGAITPTSTSPYQLSDFIDNNAVEETSLKSGGTPLKSDLRAIIRKVPNQDNQYILVVNVDSVSAGKEIIIGGVPQFKMVALESYESVAVTAGLTLADPIYPDKGLELLTKGQLQLTKQKGNGLYIFESKPFISKVNFDYELVQIDYTIEAAKPKTDVPNLVITLAESRLLFILPNGKSVEQDPKLAKIGVPSRSATNINSANERVIIIVEDDAAQQVESVVFVPDPIPVIGSKENEVINLPSFTFEKTHFNTNTGISRYSSKNRWDDVYGDGKTPGTWSGSGAIYLHLKNKSVVKYGQCMVFAGIF